jgi:Na+-translocating ferredoxin:NAD+ oxidoreductase subunit D
MADVNQGQQRAGIVLSPAPHVGLRTSTARMAWLVVACLAPATAWGILLFGLPALIVLCAAVGAALVSEALTSLFFHRFTLHDGSAFLTGLLVGLFMPPGVPVYVPIVASAFAICVVKQTFGGLGRNWMNPAMGGVVFGLLSWGGTMTRWLPALGADAAVPPLAAWKAAVAAHAAGGTPLSVLSASGYQFSGLDASVVTWINNHVLGPLGAPLAPGSFGLLIGHVPGTIGELSAPLLLLGAAILLRQRAARWQVPVVYVATFVVLSFVFGGLATGQGWLTGGPGFNLLSGSLVLGAFFVAVDPVTSPLTRTGRWIYAVVLGVITFFTRFFGSLGDGVAVAILLGNCTVPLLDRLSHRRAPRAAQEKAS